MPVTVASEGGAVVVKIPMEIKRRLGRKEVIVPDGLGGVPQPTAQEPLVVALARAHFWESLIDSGRYPSIAALAEALGVDRAYVRRIISLTTLAPSLVEAIVEGSEPNGLSLEMLVNGFPMSWKEQRESFDLKRCDDFHWDAAAGPGAE